MKKRISTKEHRMTIPEHFMQTQWRSAIHLIHPTSCKPTCVSAARANPPTVRRHQDVKNMKKNVYTEFNAVSLHAFNYCCVQLLEYVQSRMIIFHGQ